MDNLQAYVVDEVHANPSDRVTGCGCEWLDHPRYVSEVRPIESCALSAGDPSPVGRCPECDCLLYVDNAKTRAESEAPELQDIARTVVLLIEQGTIGAGCTLAELAERSRAVLAKITKGG